MSIKLPVHDDFMLPTLKALDTLGGSASNQEINDQIAVTFPLSQAQLDLVYPSSGAPIAADRMSWARSYLKIGGLVASGGRGIWVLTDAGRDALSLTNAAIRKIVADAYKQLLADKRAMEQASSSEPANPDPTEGDNWADHLLAKLKTIDPSAFERLCQRVLRESGFVKVEVTGKSGDGGIDGVGVLRMNLISFQVLFQCKRYAGSVGAGTVRDFRGAMQGRADKGLIITTGTFTPDARREATRDGAPAIDLIDGEGLCELLKDLKLGVSVRQIVTQEVTLEMAFFDTL